MVGFLLHQLPAGKYGCAHLNEIPVTFIIRPRKSHLWPHPDRVGSNLAISFLFHIPL